MYFKKKPSTQRCRIWFLPRRPLPCHGRRWQCCSGQLWSKPVAASPSLPASCSSWRGTQLPSAEILSVWTADPPQISVFIWFYKDIKVTQTHLVGETTSKQKRRSMSSQCLTVHSLRSSTTIVGLSWWNSKNMVRGTVHFFHGNIYYASQINRNTQI